jgi:heme exporter protein A
VSQPQTTPAIRAEGLTRQFGAIRALRGIDLTVDRGETVALFGPNGAGKTTLIRILTLGLRPSAGHFRIEGFDPREGSLELRARIGVISHHTFLYDDLTAAQNIAFWSALYGVDSSNSRVMHILEEVGLENRAEDAAGTFSRGMQQRLALARSLVHDPPVVFLDEPFTGLDPHAARMLRDILGRLREEGRTVLLVTHDLTRGLELSDRWCVLYRGRIADTGASAGEDPARFETRYFEGLQAAGGRR